MTSYEDLYSRLHYLEEAKQHIETVIAEKKSPKGTVNTVFAYLRQRSTTSVKGAAEEPSHLTMSLSELNSHMNTINLQTEVTSFMHQCAVDRGGLGLLRATDGSRLPTLFGNGHVRGEVVVQVNTGVIRLAGTSVKFGVGKTGFFGMGFIGWIFLMLQISIKKSTQNIDSNHAMVL